MPNGFGTNLLTLAVQAFTFRTFGAAFWRLTLGVWCQTSLTTELLTLAVQAITFRTFGAAFWRFTPEPRLFQGHRVA